MHDVCVGNSPALVARHELRAGPLLAEGGEGRVYEVVGRAGLLYKAYREPVPAGPLEGLVAWPAEISLAHPDLARRVSAATAWPTAVVLDGVGLSPRAVGLLLPRAPRRFSLRHRDGAVRLATLSYLTTEPARRGAAYGLALPPSFSPERLGLVYALARVLEALQAAAPSVSHGDLSTKNVLWSLERGPEVFLLDCDSSERHDALGRPLDAGHRRRAMTPNWDDPAIPPGTNPTPASDRYSLALIFLRVVGAAHYPIQGRQRRGEYLDIDIEVPAAARRARSLGPGAAVWDLCAAGLGAVEPAARPGAGAWAGALEEILDDLGAMSVVRSVWASQGAGSPSPAPSTLRARAGDVTVRPVSAVTRPQPSRLGPARTAPPTWRGAVPGPPPVAAGVVTPVATAPGGGSVAPGGPLQPLSTALVAPPLASQVRHGMAVLGAAWLGLHLRMLISLSTRGQRRAGAGRLVGCVIVDLFVGVVGLFLVAMIVSPWMGI